MTRNIIGFIVIPYAHGISFLINLATFVFLSQNTGTMSNVTVSRAFQSVRWKESIINIIKGKRNNRYLEFRSTSFLPYSDCMVNSHYGCGERTIRTQRKPPPNPNSLETFSHNPCLVGEGRGHC